MERHVPRRRLALAVLAAGCALLAAPAGRVAAEEPETLEGKRVVVRNPAGLDATAAAARDALDAAIGVYEKALPWRMPAGERLVLRLCATPAEYQAIVKAVGADHVLDNNAATLWKTNESVLVVLPRADPELLAATNALPDITRFLACHEGVHQFVRRAGAVGSESWPDWFSEGLADHLATECLLLDRPGETPPPVLLDDRAHFVRESVLHDRCLPLLRLLHTDMAFVESERPVYAQMWSFLRMLTSDAPKFRAFLDRVKAMPEPPGERPACLLAGEAAFERALVSVYGPLDPLEERWHARAKGAHVSWFAPYREAQVLSDGRILCAAYAPIAGRGQAASIYSATPASGPFALETVMTIGPGKNAQADLLFGFERRDAPRFLKLALGVKGYVTLMVFTEGRWQSRYQVNANVPADTFPAGRPTPVRMTVAKGTVTLFVRGEKVFDAPLPPAFDAEHGAWGVGAFDCMTIYEGLKATPLGK